MTPHPMQHIAIIGQGAIGSAITTELAERYPDAVIYTFSRKPIATNAPNLSAHHIDYHDEKSIEVSAALAANSAPLDAVIVTTGMLHDENIMPEKSLRDLSAEKFQHLFQANTITPALIAKHFLPKLNRENHSVFAALSARVGSISDNHLGGWYAYRASKAALNMIIKNAAIEIGRRNKQSIVVGLHPGTVDSNLSKPFQTHVAEGKLFTADYSAKKLITVLNNLTQEESGKCFAWDGMEIEP